MKRTVWPQLRFQNKSILNNFIINNKTVTIKNYSNNILIRNTEGTINDKVYFPCGKADFDSIRKSKQFYVDKTNFIPLMENTGNQLFFVRPPRWGKSLLLSMLASYYDINKKDEFNELFSGLWIGDEKNWTVGKNQFYILKLDFSIIDTCGSVEHVEKNFHDCMNDLIFKFLIRYNMTHAVKINESNALSTFQRLVIVLSEREEKVNFMVLIDEYDRFANKLMFENHENYRLIVEGKRGEPTSSPIRSFFELLKWSSSAAGFREFRSITTGVTPIALAGASENISLDTTFGDLVGFTENDLRNALNNVNIIGIDQDTTISAMKKYYNGYYFPGSKHALFNTTLSLYFLKKVVTDESFRNSVIEKKDIPISTLTDINTMISENVFATLETSTVLIEIIQKLFSKGYVEVSQFINPYLKLGETADPLLEDLSRTYDKTLSFMYYHGMITLTEESSKQLTPKQLVIPNEIVKDQYLKQLQRLVYVKENDVTTFINEPSQDNLKLLFNNMLEKQEGIYDNSMTEIQLRDSIESVMRAYCLFRNKDLEILEEKEDNVEYPNSKERASLIMRYSKDVFIIEFKRIRPNALTKFNNIKRWNSQIYQNTFKDLMKLSDDELLEMEVIAKVKARSILNSAIFDLKQHTKYQNDKSRNIHKFVVLQVGWPLVVRKVD